MKGARPCSRVSRLRQTRTPAIHCWSRLYAIEGGVGAVEAIVVADGRTHKAEKDIVPGKDWRAQTARVGTTSGSRGCAPAQGPDEMGIGMRVTTV